VPEVGHNVSYGHIKQGMLESSLMVEGEEERKRKRKRKHITITIGFCNKLAKT
jgi:hypothetical protein